MKTPVTVLKILGRAAICIVFFAGANFVFTCLDHRAGNSFFNTEEELFDMVAREVDFDDFFTRSAPLSPERQAAIYQKSALNIQEDMVLHSTLHNGCLLKSAAGWEFHKGDVYYISILIFVCGIFLLSIILESLRMLHSFRRGETADGVLGALIVGCGVALWIVFLCQSQYHRVDTVDADALSRQIDLRTPEMILARTGRSGFFRNAVTIRDRKFDIFVGKSAAFGFDHLRINLSRFTCLYYAAPGDVRKLRAKFPQLSWRELANGLQLGEAGYLRDRISLLAFVKLFGTLLLVMIPAARLITGRLRNKDRGRSTARCRQPL